jgi:2,3,4,5-tetrahydropyridine-2-carboxylate N-succinyltransferase
VTIDELRDAQAALEDRPEPSREAALALLDRVLTELESGRLRAAEPTDHGWVVNAWVKRSILWGFRFAGDRDVSVGVFHFRDREAFPTLAPGSGVRIVPGGSTVRRGVHLAPGVVVMPPAYVNVGAFVGEGSMVDSHVLVGSCAQIGRRVHLSAAVQVGGVLEPVGAMPVIVEDDAFIGGGCGVYEGTRISAHAVLAPGVVLTRAVALYDLVNEQVLRADQNGILVVPERAVLVPGTRPVTGGMGQELKLGLQAPMIVKYRDAGTDAALALEEALR